jgi:hypothetical protein
MNNEVKVVLNENKVKMMTKMAIYEKNEGRKMLRTAKYFKGDFIAFGILKTLITTTFAFMIVAIMYVLCNAEGRKVRIVTAAGGGHSQIVIYN